MFILWTTYKDQGYCGQTYDDPSAASTVNGSISPFFATTAAYSAQNNIELRLGGGGTGGTGLERVHQNTIPSNAVVDGKLRRAEPNESLKLL